jgi:hypothetical protein
MGFEVENLEATLADLRVRGVTFERFEMSGFDVRGDTIAAAGSYVVFNQTTATLHNAEAFQTPDAAGVQFHYVFGVWIAGSGGDDSIIDGTGGPVTSTNPGIVEPVDVPSYP